MTHDPRFDTIIDRRGTHSAKWDMMETAYGVSPDHGIPMWVADMDFPAAAPIQAALDDMRETGIYGYFGGDGAYREAIRWWMETRHGWSLDPAAIFTTHGLVNGTAMCIDAYTEPGDGVILFTPVYHAFARVIRASGRRLVELAMPMEDGAYVLDPARYDDAMTGDEKMLVLCSPHNPGGRCWTEAELEAVRDFAIRHDLILVSDEIHHDLVYPGERHIPMATVEGVEDRLVMLTSTTKTFNIAGAHIGNVIIPSEALRKPFAARMAAMGMSPNSFGMNMATAAYSPGGAEWVDALMAYLDQNRRLFDKRVNALPGLRSVPLEATYLSWVDVAGTGMSLDEALRRVEGDARIAVNHGPTFGAGGETFLRFNIGMPRARVEEALTRLEDAFADLQ